MAEEVWVPVVRPEGSDPYVTHLGIAVDHIWKGPRDVAKYRRKSWAPHRYVTLCLCEHHVDPVWQDGRNLEIYPPSEADGRATDYMINVIGG